MKSQKDQRPKREFNIVMSGQFRTLAMFLLLQIFKTYSWVDIKYYALLYLATKERKKNGKNKCHKTNVGQDCRAS